MKRSVGVTTVAVLTLVGSAFTLVMGILMLAVMIFAPIPTSPQFPGSPMFMKVLLAGVSLTYLGPAIWGIFTGIGLFRLKNWARISMIVFAVLLICMAAFSGLLTLVVPFPRAPDRAVDPSVVSVIRIFMGAFWLALLGLGIWWLVFFTRSKVKAQFVPLQPALATGLPTFPPDTAIQTAPEAPAQSEPRRPLSITILAGWLLASCAFLPLNLLIHSPAVVFTKLLTGQSAGLWYCALVAIQLFIGYGLLRLRPAARIAAIIYFGFGFLNMAVFYLAPGGRDRTLALLGSQKSMLPWMKMFSSQPDFQFDPTPFLVLGVIAGLIGIVVPIYFLVTRKVAFQNGSSVAHVG
jgi:hypothetical protein